MFGLEKIYGRVCKVETSNWKALMDNTFLPIAHGFTAFPLSKFGPLQEKKKVLDYIVDENSVLGVSMNRHSLSSLMLLSQMLLRLVWFSQGHISLQ